MDAEEHSSFRTQTRVKDLESTGWCFIFQNVDDTYFFDSLGKRSKDYGVCFEKILNGKYIMNDKQLQHNTSNLCGLNCIYYIMK